MSDDANDAPSILSRIALILTSSESIKTLLNVAGNFASSAFSQLAGDSVVKVLEWLWNKNCQRAIRKSIRKSIKELEIYRTLDRKQKKVLDGLVDHIHKEKDLVFESIKNNRSFIEIISAILTGAGFDQQTSQAIAMHLRLRLARVVAVQASDSSILELLFTVHENINTVQQYISQTLIPPIRSTYFRSLQSVLFFEDVLNDIEEWKLYGGHRPKPMFFRKPHISWLDLIEEYFYERNDLIESIEHNFENTSNMQLIVAKSGAGKTTLSFILGFKRISEWGHFTYYLNLESKTGAEIADKIIEDIERILGTINSLYNVSAVQSLGEKVLPERVLFIIDNIHVNVDVSNEIFSRYRTSKHNKESIHRAINFLFLARPLYNDFDRSVMDLQRRIAESYDEQPSKLLPTTKLQQEEFDRTIEGIISQFKEKIDIDSTLVRKISEKSRGSLWLLSFALNSLRAGQDIDELDIGDEIRKYYYDLDSTHSLLYRIHKHVFDTPFTVNRSKKERLFKALVSTISFFNAHDMPVPIDYLIESTEDITAVRKRLRGNLKFDLEMIISKLVEWGELIIVNMQDLDLVQLPHRTLAEEFWRHTPKDESSVFFLPSDTIADQPITINETLILSLLEWCRNNAPDLLENTIYNLIVINIEKYYASHIIPSTIMDYINYFNIAISRYENLFRGLLGTTVMIDEMLGRQFSTEWHQLFRNSIEQHERPWSVISFILSNEGLRDDPEICAAVERVKGKIISTLETGHETWRITRVILQRDELRNDSRITRALANAIKLDFEPWWIIREVCKWDHLRSDPHIRQAITESIKNLRTVREVCEWDDFRNDSEIKAMIARILEQHEMPWLLIREISKWADLRSDPNVIAAITRTIEHGETPWMMIHEIRKWSELRNNPMILESIESVERRIAEAIEHDEAPWTIIDNISGWSELTSDPQIRQAIAKAIEQNSASWRIISAIRKWENIMHDTLIISSIQNSNKTIAIAIKSDNEPWIILDAVGGWRVLENDPIIRAAVLSVKDKILAAITELYNPMEIVGAIYKWAELREDPEIKAAIKRAKGEIFGAIQRT